MIRKVQEWLKRATGRKLPPPPEVESTKREADAAKAHSGHAMESAEERGRHVDRVVADLRRVRLENGFGARLAYAYGLRDNNKRGRGNNHA